MADGSQDEIFFVKEGELQAMPSVEMRSGLFGKTLEDALQTLLQRYPQLIPGKQIAPDDDDPPRFVLLRREMPLSGWSLDLLLVDQRGVLTLVEAKLMQNPESRRDVIGQIIEYAANAFELWASGAARQYAAEFWNRQGRDLDEVLGEEFGADLDLESFWDTVDSNLRQGRIRMIIAADSLRPEVRRMIEYLNGEMQNAEVLGLELKCYGTGDDSYVLVPAIAGQTESARRAKRVTRSSGATTQEELLSSVFGPVRELYKDIIDRATELGMTLSWGEKGLSVRTPKKDGELVSILYAYPPGAMGRSVPFLQVYGTYLKGTSIPTEIHERLLSLPGVSKHGEYSVEVLLDGDGIESGRRSVDLMFSFQERIAGTA